MQPGRLSPEKAGELGSHCLETDAVGDLFPLISLGKASPCVRRASREAWDNPTATAVVPDPGGKPHSALGGAAGPAEPDTSLAEVAPGGGGMAGSAGKQKPSARSCKYVAAAIVWKAVCVKAVMV